jgi:hypothetical protein
VFGYPGETLALVVHILHTICIGYHMRGEVTSSTIYVYLYYIYTICIGYHMRGEVTYVYLYYIYTICIGYHMRGEVTSSTIYVYLYYTAISIKVVPRAKRKSRIRARKAAGNR